MLGSVQKTASGQAERTESLLRIHRRSLVVLLAIILVVAATLIAHVVRPGSLLADWASRFPWLLPVAIVAVLVMFVVPARRSLGPEDAEVETVMKDEFRQANVARAQRIALVVVLIAQAPLAVVASGLAAVAAVSVMSIATITIALATYIVAFLVADRG